MKGCSNMNDRSTARKLLEEVLPDAASFDAFCIEWFKDVAREFTGPMQRLERQNLLLLRVEPDAILRAIKMYARTREGEVRGERITREQREKLLAMVKMWPPKAVARGYYYSAPDVQRHD